MLYAFLTESETASSSKYSQVKSEKFESAVNKHLSLTYDKIENQKKRMALENARVDFHASRPQKAYENEHKLDLSMDNRAEELAKELGRGTRQEEYSSPHDVVQKELFNEQQKQEYTQAYKEEYARQFVENARRGGYKVILSEDLTQVLSVTPIRKPSQNMDILKYGNEGFQ